MTNGENTRLERFAAFAVGQLEALHADHRLHLEYPGVRKSLPPGEIARGRREGERWLADLWARHAQDSSERGSAARTAQLFGDLT